MSNLEAGCVRFSKRPRSLSGVYGFKCVSTTGSAHFSVAKNERCSACLHFKAKRGVSTKPFIAPLLAAYFIRDRKPGVRLLKARISLANFQSSSCSAGVELIGNSEKDFEKSLLFFFFQTSVDFRSWLPHLPVRRRKRMRRWHLPWELTEPPRTLSSRMGRKSHPDNLHGHRPESDGESLFPVPNAIGGNKR